MHTKIAPPKLYAWKSQFLKFLKRNGVQLLFTDHHIIVTKTAFFFSIAAFFHDHTRITGLQGKGERISLTPHYHFHPLHRHLDISRAITA